MAEGQPQTLASIQALRGIAALMVVGYHLFPQMERMGYPSPPIDMLTAGVDIFFVVSGFIMWHTTAARPERTALRFYRDRFIRIVPLYWALSLFVVAMMIAAPELLQSTRFDVWHIAASFLFLPAQNHLTGAWMPILAPGWTLNLEMLFYLIFGGAIATTRRPVPRAAVLIGALFALVAGIAALNPAGAFAFYGNDVMLEFAFGVGLALTYDKLPRNRSTAWLAIAGAFALLALGPTDGLPRSLAYGMPATLIVGGALMVPQTLFGPLKALGDSSYSLYLSHPLTMSAAGQAWRKLELPVWGFPLFGVTVCVAVGLATYYLIERPLIRAGKSSSGLRIRNRAVRHEGGDICRVNAGQVSP